MSSLLRPFFLLVAILAALPPAAPAHTPHGSETLARFQDAVRQAWPPQDVTMHGAVKFVHGNDLWQPGRQFKAGREWLALACDQAG